MSAREEEEGRGEGKGNQTREASEGGAREKRQGVRQGGTSDLGAPRETHNNGRQIPDCHLVTVLPHFFSKLIYVTPLALSSVITAISYS